MPGYMFVLYLLSPSTCDCYLTPTPFGGRGKVAMTGTRRSRYRTEHIPGHFRLFLPKKNAAVKSRRPRKAEKKTPARKSRKIKGKRGKKRKKAEQSGKTRDGGEKQP